ncbi:hypothetical protein FRC01_005093 [Tulasnella sp. 417]|nr:hypothetical protein FRC01_005093 [Tulasnella sp. 417]
MLHVLISFRVGPLPTVARLPPSTLAVSSPPRHRRSTFGTIFQVHQARDRILRGWQQLLRASHPRQIQGTQQRLLPRKTLKHVEQVLKDAGMKKEDIDDAVLEPSEGINPEHLIDMMPSITLAQGTVLRRFTSSLPSLRRHRTFLPSLNLTPPPFNSYRNAFHHSPPLGLPSTSPPSSDLRAPSLDLSPPSLDSHRRLSDLSIVLQSPAAVIRPSPPCSYLVPRLLLLSPPLSDSRRLLSASPPSAEFIRHSAPSFNPSASSVCLDRYPSVHTLTNLRDNRGLGADDSLLRVQAMSPPETVIDGVHQLRDTIKKAREED